jgi:hypothetical protein
MKKELSKFIWEAAGVVVLASVFITLLIVAPGTPFLAVPIFFLEFHATRGECPVEKEWLRAFLKTAGILLIILLIVLILCLFVPFIGVWPFMFLFAPWEYSIMFPVENTIMEDPAAVIYKDPNNSALAAYTRDDLIFDLNISGYRYDLKTDWGKTQASRNMAYCSFKMDIYMKEKTGNTVYRIKRMVLKTKDYTVGIRDCEAVEMWDQKTSSRYDPRTRIPNDFIKEIRPSFFNPGPSYNPTMYKVIIEGWEFLFPFPKGGNFSVDVDVEIEIDNGDTRTNYDFTYYFKIRKERDLGRNIWPR